MAKGPTRRHRSANNALGANPAWADAERDRRTSGAAGSHDSRPRRQRTRAARRQAALSDF